MLWFCDVRCLLCVVCNYRCVFLLLCVRSVASSLLMFVWCASLFVVSLLLIVACCLFVECLLLLFVW